eukprot:TRINITY_DN988_c0_g1_i2.p1 TRINITY_DN988_c0_g1~~TRINITY_DN988_c0_g1_i2.p1  ORF type:complete len:730 (-),score=145.14 TRINITY_DN988_c0_g1_i2:40-2175(-)
MEVDSGKKRKSSISLCIDCSPLKVPVVLASAFVECLPDEVMLHIFSFLELTDIVTQVSRTCRVWSWLCSDHSNWERLDFTKGTLHARLSDTTFRRCMQMFSSARYINLSYTNVTSKGVEIIASTCTKLVQLELAYCPRLKHTNLSVLHSLPTLSSLNLMGTLRLNDSNVMGTLQSFRRFDKLGVSLDLTTIEATHALKEVFRQVHWMDLRVTPDGAENLFNMLPDPKISTGLRCLEIVSRGGDTQLHALPETIGLLSSLTSLIIRSHKLSSLPPQIGQLSKLESLVLSGCNKLRLIPPQTAPHDSPVSDLYEPGDLSLPLFSPSPLQYLPPEVAYLSRLEVLDISCNNLRALPDDICNMTRLVKLDASCNLIHTLPDDMGAMVSLRSLRLSHNQIRVLPPSMARLINLEKMKIAHNTLKTIPQDIFSSLTKLKVAQLQVNRLRRLPSDMGRTITHLSVYRNSLEDLPSGLCDLTDLKQLSAHHNSIQTLPQNLCRLTSLASLSLHTNFIETLPTNIHSLAMLEELELQQNCLSTLPLSMSALPRLRRVDLRSNLFSNLQALLPIGYIPTLRSAQFDGHLHMAHSVVCPCKFCTFARFDEAHFDDVVEGDIMFEKELVELFFECMTGDLTLLRHHVDQANFPGIFFIGHKIKGALSNMGATKLGLQCTQLEKYARAMDLVNCQRTAKCIEIEYASIKQVLNRKLDTKGLVRT